MGTRNSLHLLTHTFPLIVRGFPLSDWPTRFPNDPHTLPQFPGVPPQVDRAQRGIVGSPFPLENPVIRAGKHGLCPPMSVVTILGSFPCLLATPTLPTSPQDCARTVQGAQNPTFLGGAKDQILGPDPVCNHLRATRWGTYPRGTRYPRPGFDRSTSPPNTLRSSTAASTAFSTQNVVK